MARRRKLKRLGTAYLFSNPNLISLFNFKPDQAQKVTEVSEPKGSPSTQLAQVPSGYFNWLYTNQADI